MQQAKAWAREGGLERIQLTVWPTNAPASRF